MSATLPPQFAIAVRFDSDWHIGSGFGRPASIDRLVRRDPDGFPYVPAKTVTGIWRDASELVATGLDGGTTGPWTRWVEYVFGRQGRGSDGLPTSEARLSVRSARLPAGLREALALRPRCRAALTFAKWGVSIDPRSGRARERFLRQEEMARMGLVLDAQCALDIAEEYAEIVSALLIAGASMVDRLGGKRRRGAGRCQLRIDGVDDARFRASIDLIERTTTPVAPPLEDAPASEASSSVALTPGVPSSREARDVATCTSGDRWVSLPLVIETLTPLVIEARSVGNVVETFDFVTGSRLLPVVTRVLRELGLDPDRAVAANDLCVSHATIELDGERSRPVPMSLMRPKGEPGLGASDGETASVRNRLVEPWTETSPAKEHRGWVAEPAPGHLPRLATVPIRAETHATIDDGTQRPTAAVGGVFTYQSIDAGVRLCADLRLRGELAGAIEERDPQWWRRFHLRTTIGRSKKDDYGLVQLSVHEQGPRTTTSLPGARGRDLMIWICSDTLLLDERLRPDTGARALARALAARLGVGIQPRRATDAKDTRLHSISRVRRTDGWQARWKMARPSLVGIAAGSVFAFVANADLDPSQLAALEAEGIGERRAEGFGEVRVNHPLLVDSLAGRPAACADRPANRPADLDARRTESLIRPGTDSHPVSRTLERAAWRSAIAERALEVATRRSEHLKWRAGSRPTSSQLGALRMAISRLRGESDAPTVAAWLDRLAKNERRRKSWPEGSIEAVATLVADRDRAWQILELPEAELALTDDGRAAMRRELWAEAVRTLLSTAIALQRREMEA